MNLKNKRILITAGPTWVTIDNVRVISNIATGRTGILLANEFIDRGARVTLVLGPVIDKNINKKVRVVAFRFFDQLKEIVIKEIKSKKYDILIHSAAVSDYKPKAADVKKIKSGIKNFKLALEPTPKIIERFKELRRGAFLVGFKFEPGAGKSALLAEASGLIERSKADLVVANTVNKNGYKAYIVSNHKTAGPFLNKELLAANLVKEIGEHLCGN